jgi:uncharacterized protein (DUF1800 family)
MRFGFPCFSAAISLVLTFAASAQSVDRLLVDGFDDRFPRATTANDASRFLSQASFGAREAEISALTGERYAAWIESQFVRPRTAHIDYVRWLASAWGYNTNDGIRHLHESFWKQVAYGQDPLRQRIAWALAQIFVVSSNGTPSFSPAQAAFYDVLNQHAFGRYRDLLEAVSLSATMGQYLSHISNLPEDPTTGRLPDENYAREVMQLFSIGLWELNPDGTRRLNAQNQPIPTYGQAEIRGMAAVFTGWTYYHCPTQTPFNWWCWYGARLAWEGDEDKYLNPMRPYAPYHSTGAKRIIGGITLPAGRTAEVDLRDALDALANHPNVGPFIGKQLIQRLVKSNPSPAYVARVSAAFANNGSGVRGDLRAVVRAVLLDPEARDPALISDPNAGKLREPVQRWVQFLRVFTVPATNGRAYYDVRALNEQFGQLPFMSPSVFNFYRPTYAPPGELRTLGLVAPEFQITNDYTVAETHNVFAFWLWVNPDPNGWEHRQDSGRLYSIASNVDTLIDRLDLLLTAGTLSSGSRAAIRSALVATPDQTARVKIALKLFFAAPDFQVQK